MGSKKENKTKSKRKKRATTELVDSYIPTDGEGITFAELRRQLEEKGISQPAVSRAVRNLKNEGRIISENLPREKTYLIRRAGTSPKLPEKEIISRSLCLGEMAFGTKAYDPDTMTGLAFWLKETKRTDIDNVFMVGGMVPRIPAWYSVSGSNAMRFLGNDPEKPHSEDLETLLENADLNRHDAEYFRNHVDRKILTYQDALNVVGHELGKLTSILKNAEWHYQHGEEDALNIQQAKEIMITDAAKKRLNLEQYAKELEELQDRKQKIEERYRALTKRQEVFSYVKRRVAQTNRRGDALNAFLNLVTKDTIEKYSLAGGDAEEINSILAFDEDSIQRVKQHYNSLKEETESISGEIDRATNKIEDMERKIDSVNRQLAAWGFFKVTKRVEVKPEEEEIFFRLAKTKYNDRIYEAFPRDTERVHIHTSSRKAVGGLVRVDEAELLRFLLVHNPNHLGSNIPTYKDLIGLKEEAKRVAKLYRILSKDIPDVLLSSHGKGGFRFQPQLKYREEIVAGEYRKTPEMVLHMKLPTFQSVPNLEYLAERGLKNEHTKRYAAGDYASGAVIHTAYSDGSFDVEYIDVSSLIKFSRIGKELEVERARLKKLSPKENTNERRRVREKIKKLKCRLNFELEQIELDGDAHLGAANMPGRASNYDYVDAIKAYQYTNGLPTILVISEPLNAAIPKVVDANQQYFGLLPSRFEELWEKEKNRTDISMAKKLERLESLAKTQLHSTPITHTDLIAREWKNRCLPYVHEVLAGGGQVVLASGNHYNKSGSGRDEATILSLAISPEYKDQVHILNGIGEQQGLGEVILPDGKRMYVAHRLRSGKDELLPAFKQMRGAGVSAEIVLCFDRHHTAGGVADGTIYALGPAKQTWNPYVDEIGKPSSPRGLMNLFVTKSQNGDKVMYAKWSLVLDPTLEQYYMPSKVNDLNFK